jgi:hypothetical protein
MGNDDPQNLGHKFWLDHFVSKAIDHAADILKTIDERELAELIR